MFSACDVSRVGWAHSRYCRCMQTPSKTFGPSDSTLASAQTSSWAREASEQPIKLRNYEMCMFVCACVRTCPVQAVAWALAACKHGSVRFQSVAALNPASAALLRSADATRAPQCSGQFVLCFRGVLCAGMREF